ncbi:MAG: hypothetical protein M9921_07120 [Fimbriimonadaceae bacterium]|nr:hypothetical protein [Chthonomonadaceae bacterium]MCO5296610.1 hypothetical protein [Fimbriimonadaceae bacterium]
MTDGQGLAARRKIVSVVLRIPVSILLLHFVATVVQTVFADLLLRKPESFERLRTLANPRILYSDPAADISPFYHLYWVPFVAFAILTFVAPSRRVPAYLGAIAGYLFGWATFAPTTVLHDFAFWPWVIRVVAIAAAAGLTFTLFEPALEVVEVWLSRPRRFVMAALAAGAVGAVFAYPVAADYVDGRVAFRVDRQHLASTYRAIVLYEADHDGEAPKSLPNLVPGYLDERQLQSPKDSRPRRNPDGYPADLYVFRKREYAHYAPFRVSYAYARSFERTLVSERSWEEIRADPDFGLLANEQHCYLRDPSQHSMPGALTPISPSTLEDHGDPTDAGPVMRVMMDGSLRVLQKDAYGVGDIPERLFYSWY